MKRQLHQVSPDKKLIIILDNGSIHKSRKVRVFVKKQGWGELFFLPPYSPDYNSIERFWL
ncbi:transposase [Legionella antarctica]|uniref:transposase n=1 Tax=Legionella antarctica TaxID=2708020 RepID=UPI00156307B2